MKNYSILILLLFVCGCGSGGATVKGTVKFDDGTPLTTGYVKFIGNATEASGAIKTDGTYVLGELKAGDGVKPGHYKVVVVGAMIIPPAPASQTSPSKSPARGELPPAPPPTYLIDRKFETPATSGLTCEVKGAMTYDITVTKP